GIYWKYESWLKKMDSELYSVVGAAGELFSIRKSLFIEVEPNAILDDFIISLRIAQQGYLVKYEPQAYSVEMASSSVEDEIKRKVRISAGGIQSIIWLKDLLNPIKHGILSFQYISHRVLRWTLTPLALAFVLITNLILAYGTNGLYDYLLVLQLGFYLLALLGWLLENYKIKIKALFVPFYFTMMNVCVYLGFLRFLRGRQSVVWEKARRAQ
ncbi:MAG: glycosyltransferase family 2 protein, partial [Bacteroidota bacterium]